MRIYRTTRGPFTEQPFFTLGEIEQICTDELRKLGLYPSRPEPIRIDRFIEKRFGIAPEYDELPAGVLGFTRFGPKGVEGIIVAKTLAEDTAKASERRVNSTLAHEAGHGLLHAHLFVIRESAANMFGSDYDPKAPKILCRDVITPEHHILKTYDGRWWEFQANQTIGAMLLPRDLVGKCLTPLLKESGSFGVRLLKPENVKAAIDLLVETFNVNSAVAKIRLGQLYPPQDAAQLTL